MRTSVWFLPLVRRCAPRVATQSKSSTGLPSTKKGVEEVGALSGGDYPPVVAEPPPELVALDPRADLDLATRGSGLDGISDQDLGKVIECLGVGPGLQIRGVDITDQVDSSDVAF